MSLKYQLRQTGAEVQAAIDKIIALEPGALDAIGIFIHDTEYWQEHADDVPSLGALLIYNDVNTGEFKIGNGEDTVSQLKFVGADLAETVAEHIAGQIRHITSQERQYWNNKSDFSGRYQDLTGRPYIPTKLSDLSEDATHRTVTDEEKADWSRRETFIAGAEFTTFREIEEAYYSGKAIFLREGRRYYTLQFAYPPYSYTFSAVDGGSIYIASVDFLGEWTYSEIVLSEQYAPANIVPAQASVQNQLADKDFVNTSIATASAVFRGTMNLVTDLGLTLSATEAQIADALATAITGEDNNDYAFVQIPTAEATPEEIARVDRYKYNGTVWAFEFSLNNTAFTAEQWAALNSGITAAKVAKIEPFFATYELTTFAEVSSALSAGKQVYVSYGWFRLAYIGSFRGTSYMFSCLTDYGTVLGASLGSNNEWASFEVEINKVSGGVEGHLVSIDQYGNIIDSGKAATDIPTDVVKYIAQSLTDAQKTQARENIGAGTYSKPSGGIPASDIAPGVIPAGVTVDQTYDPTSQNAQSGVAMAGALAGKQDTINDLQTIRSGASAGATAYQKPQTGIPASDLAAGVIPTVPTDVVKYSSQSLTDAQKGQARTNIGAGTYSKPSGGIPKSDLDSGVKASLELADSAIQPAEFNELEEEVGTIGNGAYEEAWDGSSAPVVADIPAGVSVTYNGTSYTGTLAASASTVDKIYLVSDGNGNYDRYVTVESGGTYSWKKVGTTAIPLSNYATKSQVDQLGQKVGFIIEVSNTGLFFVDSQLNIGAYIDSNGIYAINILGFTQISE